MHAAGNYHKKTFKYDPGAGAGSYGPDTPMYLDLSYAVLLEEGGTEIFVSPSVPDGYNPFIFDTVGAGTWTRLEYNPFNGYKLHARCVGVQNKNSQQYILWYCCFRCTKFKNTDGRDLIVTPGGVYWNGSVLYDRNEVEIFDIQTRTFSWGKNYILQNCNIPSGFTTTIAN